MTVLRSTLVFMLLAVAGCASTSKVMLGPARPPIPAEAVRVYVDPPARFQEIARLEADSAIGFGTPGQTDSAIATLRREAAALGANGLLLLGVDTVRPPVGVSVGTGIVRRHVGVFGSVGVPTSQRRAVGVAIWVVGDRIDAGLPFEAPPDPR
ncbi:MAG TPA: hypothetical protein VFM73_02350 [Xanthomonadaceae bacterium]|nr:hypothetical protein [Xanthomonadaceae bacterium]